jgi:hypothetical protein
MVEKLNILKVLKPNYFWDVDIDKLDIDRSKRLIIERVFALGTAKEIMLVINHYGDTVVISVLKGLNYMDPKTLNFVSKLFNISVQSFKCYKRKQLIPQHWDS